MMDDYVKTILEKEKEERILEEKSIQEKEQFQRIEKNIEKLGQEEETLKNYLDKLRKENFTLQTSLNALQTSLKKKLDEFKKAELKLDKLYNDIWSKREDFCCEADKFNDEYGILSNRWRNQLNYVNDLEKFGLRRAEENQNREDTEKLQNEIDQLKKEIEAALSKAKGNPEIENFDSDRQKQTSSKAEHLQEVNEENVDILEAEEDIQMCSENIVPPNNDLFSILDINELKRINRGVNLLSTRCYH